MSFGERARVERERRVELERERRVAEERRILFEGTCAALETVARFLGISRTRDAYVAVRDAVERERVTWKECLQIFESFGAGALEMLAEAAGRADVRALRAAVEAGGVSAREVFPRFASSCVRLVSRGPRFASKLGVTPVDGGRSWVYRGETVEIARLVERRGSRAKVVRLADGERAEWPIRECRSVVDLLTIAYGSARAFAWVATADRRLRRRSEAGS